MKITSRLDKLSLWYDYIIVCDDIKRKVVEKKYNEKFKTTTCKWGVELTNPIEYTKEQILKKYDGKTRVERWVHTYRENGQPAMAVVLM